MEAAARDGRHEAVLEQGQLAREAIRSARRVPRDDADETPSRRGGGDGGADEGVGPEAEAAGDGGGPGKDELSPLALSFEVSAAGELGLWERVSPVLSRATRSPALRGVAGVKLYSALIGAAVACGRPQRGLEVFREMEEEASGRAGGGRGGSARGGHRDPAASVAGCGPLPPPDARTYAAALEACAAVGGQESVVLAIDVTRSAAAASVAKGAREASPRLSSSDLAAILGEAGRVCAAAGNHSAGEALAGKANEMLAVGSREEGLGGRDPSGVEDQGEAAADA